MMKIINSLDRRVLANQPSCFPSSSLALLPLQPFAIVRTVLVQGGWWYCAITYITQSVPNTGVTQCTPYQYCTHRKFHVSTVHTYVYIHMFQLGNLPSSNLLHIPLTTQYKLYIITLKTLVWLE